MARVIDSLADALDPRVSKREATDLLWAFSNEELYRELVEERGWSPERFSSAGSPRRFASNCSA